MPHGQGAEAAPGFLESGLDPHLSLLSQALVSKQVWVQLISTDQASQETPLPFALHTPREGAPVPNWASQQIPSRCNLALEKALGVSQAQGWGDVPGAGSLQSIDLLLWG